MKWERGSGGERNTAVENSGREVIRTEPIVTLQFVAQESVANAQMVQMIIDRRITDNSYVLSAVGISAQASCLGQPRTSKLRSAEQNRSERVK